MVTARKRSAARKTSTVARKRALVAAVATGFAPGDVVFVEGDTTPATVCRVVEAGARYKVLFAGDSACTFMPHSALRAAPPGTPGPSCAGVC
jgi:hypothetical protein